MEDLQHRSVRIFDNQHEETAAPRLSPTPESISVEVTRTWPVASAEVLRRRSRSAASLDREEKGELDPRTVAQF